ncbi:uncharacterized protein METZ01_LOCUS227621 [marine metagenome]|uniref:Uncharacterized protein n=1 Tax=marine metagenome TaxID=408172 RepID=A0A382GJF4_9ZZZZ
MFATGEKILGILSVGCWVIFSVVGVLVCSYFT